MTLRRSIVNAGGGVVLEVCAESFTDIRKCRLRGARAATRLSATVTATGLCGATCTYGAPMMWTCAHGLPAHMMYAPVGLCVVGSPVVFGSKGHLIIQCGPTVIAGLVVSLGSESFLCVAPASLYVIPGSRLVGLGL